MKEFTRYIVSVTNEEAREILIAILGDHGIDAFEEKDDSLVASGLKGSVDYESIDSYLDKNGYSWSKDDIADQNWNAIWESSFEPVTVDDFAAVRAAFHQPIKTVEHEIVITPKMSFGTGHHATTWLVMQMMRDIDFAQKAVFDFGTGTGVLAILAEKLGATSVLAIDNDEWSISNALENISTNSCRNIRVQLAEEPPANGEFEVVLANINKLILLAHINTISAITAGTGTVVLSGLLVADEEDIVSAASQNSLFCVTKHEKNGWITLLFQKRKSEN